MEQADAPRVSIRLRRHFGAWVDVQVAEGEQQESGHGGGDERMLRDLFEGSRSGSDILGRAADHLAGARACLVGCACNLSLESGKPIKMKRLLKRASEREPAHGAPGESAGRASPRWRRWLIGGIALVFASSLASLPLHATVKLGSLKLTASLIMLPAAAWVHATSQLGPVEL